MRLRLLDILPFITIGFVMQAKVFASDIEQIPSTEEQSTIGRLGWKHGSADCEENNDRIMDVYKYDEHSFILRQNKCLTYEAPFIYVLVGSDKILVLDTGALEESSEYSLSAEIVDILGENVVSSKQMLVVHSHSHSDHTKGDSSFKRSEKVVLVEPSAKAINHFFNFTKWPNEQTIIELGGRKITAIPTPGHQEESISFYDHQTQWLMTGDTLYPGVIYIKNWQAYRKSIDRLASFAEDNEISAILGAHIEMTQVSGVYYPIGSTYQPDEAKLELNVASLNALNAALQISNKPTEIVLDRLIVKPMGVFQRTLSNIVRWFKR